MVGGLNKFKEHFGDSAHQYVLIGGTACDLLHTDQGLSFRATKDLDIVLCVEALDKGFFARFWNFVRLGGYQIRQEDSARCLYRFEKPTDPAFPAKLELFSRKPDVVEVPEGAKLVPLPAGEGASSLSAILLDEASYRFLMEGTIVLEGVCLANAERLIPLKAFAWANLKRDKAEGRGGDGGDIKKHRRDIYRLSRLLAPADRVVLPPNLSASLREWLAEGSSNPLQAGDPVLEDEDAEEIHTLIRTVFQL